MGVPRCPMHTPDGVCVGKFTKGNQTKPKGCGVLALERLDWQSIGYLGTPMVFHIKKGEM